MVIHHKEFLEKAVRKSERAQWRDVSVLRQTLTPEEFEDFYCDALAYQAEIVDQLDDEMWWRFERLMGKLQPVSDHQLRGHLFYIKNFQNDGCVH